MVLDCAYLVRSSWPRVCVVAAAVTMKLEANIDAVILWQSVQLQMKVSTRPGGSVG